jgi:hypothetical protein
VSDEQDITRTCRVCSKDFVVTPKEQKWFLDRDLTLPGRCKACRQLKRQTRLHDPREYVSHTDRTRES